MGSHQDGGGKSFSATLWKPDFIQAALDDAALQTCPEFGSSRMKAVPPVGTEVYQESPCSWGPGLEAEVQGGCTHQCWPEVSCPEVFSKNPA